MNDAEKVREAIRFAEEYRYREWLGAQTALDSILTELAEAKRKLARYAVEGDRHDGSCLQVKSEALERAVAAEERAENAERERNETRERWSAEHVRANSAEARIQTLEAALREIIEGEFDDLDPDDGLHPTSARAVARQALAEDEA